MRARRSLSAVVGLVAVAALALTACSSPDEQGSTAEPPAAADGDTFPVTITHAFGETVVEAPPERVATWGWGSTEAALAVGVAPVGVAEQVWTVGPQALLPWVEEAYDDAGADHPAIFSDPEAGATVPYEEFVAVEPDLILAPYSGLTAEQYEVLSEIAPVVAYPDAPWTTGWDEIITITAQALGRSDDGDAVLADIDSYLADAAATLPDAQGKTFVGLVDSPTEGLVYLYTSADPRAGFMERLGLELAPVVDEIDESDGSDFYVTLSYEELDRIDADFVLAYTYTEEEAETFGESDALQAIPAVAAGDVIKVVGTVAVSSVSPPTALSVTWPDGVPAVVEDLAELY